MHVPLRLGGDAREEVDAFRAGGHRLVAARVVRLQQAHSLGVAGEGGVLRGRGAMAAWLYDATTAWLRCDGRALCLRLTCSRETA